MRYSDEVRQMFKELEADGSPGNPFVIDGYYPSELDLLMVSVFDVLFPAFTAPFQKPLFPDEKMEDGSEE